MLLTIFSWSACALILGASALTLSRREQGAATYLLVAALIAGALLEGAETLALASSNDYLFWKRCAVSLEGALPVLFFLFSVFYARHYSWSTATIVTRLLLALMLLLILSPIFLPPAKLFYAPDLLSERMIFLTSAGFVFYIAVFVYLVAALFNLESTYRSALRPDQWQIKFTILGVGSLLGLFIFYYSQGLLYRSINMNLAPLRTLALYVAGGLLIYSLLHRNRLIRVTISKEMAFRSVVLVIVGGYLILLGLLGEGLRYFGEASQQVIFISVFFLGCVFLVALLLSEQMKRKVKVFINKNFFDNKYDYRIQWLKFTSRLAETRSNEELDAAILSGFCDTFAMGGAQLYLWVPEQGVYFNRGCYQSEPCRVVLTRDNPLIRYMVEQQWVFNAAYYEQSVLDANHAFLTTERISFTVPIFSGSDLEGFIALIRPINPGEEYSYEDYDLMKTLARQAAFALTSARLTEQLAVAREMEAMGKVSAFVMHDLKNHVYSLSLLTANATVYISDPEFQEDLLGTLANTVAKMKILIAKLKDLPESHELHLTETNLLDLANELVASLSGGDITVSGRNIFVLADQEELGKVVANLLINALDAIEGLQGGAVSVEVGGSEQSFIRVQDNGCGMTPEFIRKDLFTPFKSTKNKGLGIGLFQSRQIVAAHKGRIEVMSEPGKGSTFIVWLPASIKLP